jgi:hypothetical protein
MTNNTMTAKKPRMISRISRLAGTSSFFDDGVGRGHRGGASKAGHAVLDRRNSEDYKVDSG